MKSYSTLLSLVFVAVCLAGVSGNKTTAGNEDAPFLASAIDVNSASETRPAAAVVAASEQDKKLLVPLLVKKPLVVTGSLLASANVNQKNPSIPSPSAAARPTASNNNVLVVIGDNSQQQLVEKSKDDESRKLLIPTMAMKPLLIVSALTGAKLVQLPAISPPKIGITITKHEYPPKFADDTMP